MVAKLFKNRIKDILAKFQESEIIKVSDSANYFGLESKGVKQIRGNGVLILTKKKLYFEMWVKPKTIIEIPINSIQKIESVKSHLKKSRFQKLLKVIFTTNRGNTDSVAWLVRDLNEWMQILDKLEHASN
jgi:hypothetical protein